MPTIEIDGKTLDVENGKMIIEAADEAGIYIPRFCYHDKLSIAANCRMCLVEVEKAPKPLPACATPVGDGMVIKTSSPVATEAQKGTMEFLLINHPLDCPVCDQGGECPLQDQAMGYGKGVSRFTEAKRVVENKEIGPLISTEMTRCIHCTRCVRFGQEVAGLMELGVAGRGERMEIGSFLGTTVDSEVSGNMIDLCPVGALTSRPYRFTARSWELSSHDSVSPHDSLGSNLKLQISHGEVKRVLPRDNEDVNECWISDRDRYSYEGVNSPDRLTTPMVKHGNEWVETDWQSALNAAVVGLKRTLDSRGKDQLAAFSAPGSTTEEHFLLQKLVRALGSGNVDHRLRQRDFSADQEAPLAPSLGRTVASLDDLKSCLLVGSNIRKEQPLLGVRLRKASLNGCVISAVNPVDFDFSFRTKGDQIVSPAKLASALAAVASAVADKLGTPLPGSIAEWRGSLAVDDAARVAAEKLVDSAGDGAVILGAIATQSRDYAALRAIADWIADATGASFGELPEANSAGAWLAGAVHHRGPAGVSASVAGLDPNALLERGTAGLLLLGVEPEFDALRADAMRSLVDKAEFVVAMSAFSTGCEGADVLLPVAPFTENEGTMVNLNGVSQSFSAAIPCLGDARPAWKVLRVLGNLFDVSGFDYVKVSDIASEISFDAKSSSDGPAVVPAVTKQTPDQSGNTGLERVIEVPLYRVDSVVRRSDPLQATLDNPGAIVGVGEDVMSSRGLTDGGRARISAGGQSVELTVRADSRLPKDCVYIPAGYAETAALGATTSVTVETA